MENTQEFRDMTKVTLANEIKTAMEFMGPGEFATQITVNIEDTEYLRDVIKQMQNNYDGR